MALSAPVNICSNAALFVSGASFGQTTTAAAAIGDTVVLWVSDDGSGGTWAITDTGGNTWSPMSAQQNLSNNYAFAGFYSVLTTALPSSSTITMTKTGGAGGSWDLCMIAAKITTGLTLDKAANATGATAAWNGGTTAATTVNDEIILGASAAGGAPTSSAPGSGYTEVHDLNGSSFIDLTSVYQIVSATGTQQASGTWSASDSWAAVTVTFFETGAAGGGVVTGPTFNAIPFVPFTGGNP